MKLIRQIMEKKMELHNELMFNKKYARGIWQFYCCYNLAMAILGKVEDKVVTRKRDIIFKNILKGKFNDKKLKKIQEFLQRDMAVVVEAFKHMEEQSQDIEYEGGNLDRDWAVAIVSYELED